MSLTDRSAAITQAIASIPTYLDLAANVSSMTVQRDPGLASHISAKAVAGIAVGLTIAVFLIVLASLLIIRKHRKNKRGLAAISNEHDTTPDWRPYLDQKAETEGRQRCELEALDLRYEMEGKNSRQEIGPAQKRQGIQSLGITHEARGEDPSREMPVERDV